MLNDCSVTRKLQVVPGTFDDYRQLAHYHYRNGSLGPTAGLFALKPVSPLSGLSRKDTVGVIVYTMPTARLELRNVAAGNFFAGLDRSTQLALINENIRCISRVIIEPRFRGLGLAIRLVRETMPQLNVPIIEAMAVMGAVNPFFEKAGMKAFTGKVPARCIQLIEALSMVGIEQHELIDPQIVQRKIAHLSICQTEFIEFEIKRFLQSYGKRSALSGSSGPEQTRYILSKLTARPIYYIWFNPAEGGFDHVQGFALPAEGGLEPTTKD
jgi:hypothetical protein